MRTVSVTLAVTVLLIAGTAHGADYLYQSVVRVTGQHEDTRPDALARAFTDNLIKVSGDARLADDPRVAALATNAADVVADYSYRDLMEGIPLHDEQGTRQRPYELTVTFAPEKIDAILADLGKQPWTNRPAVLVDAEVINGDVRFTLTADGSRGADMRDALAAESQRVGLQTTMPVEGAVPTPAGNTVLLSGAITWDADALGWTADWSFTDAADRHAWTIAGVSFDAAFRNGLRGVALVKSGNGEP